MNTPKTQLTGEPAVASSDGLGEIFVISKVWTDSLENHFSAAFGYEVVGFVETKQQADKIIADAGMYQGTGWPIDRNEKVPLLKAERVLRYSPNAGLTGLSG